MCLTKVTRCAGSAALLALAVLALAVIAVAPSGSWVEGDFTSADANGNPVAIAMGSTSKNGAGKSSRENGTYAPRLVVEYAP